jgi:hypothetical protein
MIRNCEICTKPREDEKMMFINTKYFCCDACVRTYKEILTIQASGGGGGVATWGTIIGVVSDQLDLQSALDTKAGTTHAHAITDVTGLDTSLSVLAGSIDTKEPIIAVKQSAFNKAFGSVTDTVCQGNDARLSDSRTPTAHTHVKANITDFAHTHPQTDVTGLVTDLGGKEPANANIQAHVISTHAPANAQKNSDILQSEIEAKLTGVISTHSHAGGGTPIGYMINVQALTSSPTDAQTIYFGMLPKAPTTTANISKIYIRKAGTIKIAEIYCYSGTAGTGEAWSIYIRKNNSADTLIQTVSLANSERVFSNSALNIAVIAGDYIEIKGIQPTWATNPATTIWGGYIYIE